MDADCTSTLALSQRQTMGMVGTEMRILICHYNPDQGGGAESAVRDQKKALELRGHEVMVEHQMPERAYRRWAPDIMHFHTIHVTLSLSILQWAQDNHIPHCLSLHDYWPFCSGRMLLRKGDEPCAAVTGLCDERCESCRSDPEVTDLVNGSNAVTFNPYSAAIMERHGVHIACVIPHGIDTGFFRPNWDTQNQTAIMTSSAWPDFLTKGMHVLRAALKKIGREATLVSGKTREVVRNQLQRHGIFVFPSCYEETYGLCLTEAMASGCACIASDVAGPRAQIEDGDTGLLVPPRSPTALAGAIEGLIANDNLRSQLGHNARAWAESFATLERMGQDYEEFYAEVIDGS